MRLTRTTPDATGRQVVEVDGLVLAGGSATNRYLDLDLALGAFVASATFVSQAIPVSALVTASRALTAADVFVPVQTATSAITLTLPALNTGLYENHAFRIKDATGHAATHAITLNVTGTDRFHDTTSSKTITTNFGRLYVVGRTLTGALSAKRWIVISAA